MTEQVITLSYLECTQVTPRLKNSDVTSTWKSFYCHYTSKDVIKTFNVKNLELIATLPEGDLGLLCSRQFPIGIPMCTTTLVFHMYMTVIIPGVFMYLLISSNSCVLSLGVFMAMDSTAPWNNRYTCSGSNSYHIRGKYVLTDDLCMYVASFYCACTQRISPGTQGSFWP